MTIPSQEVPEGSEALKPFTKREREQLFVMTANGLQLSQAHRGWNDAAKLTMALRYEATIAELEKRSVSQPLPEAAPQPKAFKSGTLSDLSDDRRAAKTWLPQSDKDVSDGRVVLRDGSPHCANHGAMNKLERDGFIWRCSCGVGCEYRPEAAPESFGCATCEKPLGEEDGHGPICARCIADARREVEARRSPLCECGHAKHEGQCKASLHPLRTLCECQGSVSGETAAPATPTTADEKNDLTLVMGERDAALSRVEELKRERADERKSLDTLSGLYYKLHDDFSALHDSKSHVEAERDELRGAFLKLREEVANLSHAFTCPRNPCDCNISRVLSLLDRATTKEANA